MSNVRRVYVEKKGSYDVQQKALAIILESKT